ncbi:hypothetical protein [Streptomyces sp. CBMA156]|uniref:hypothetical protein n=1 Tax=Streptomyces sp. CBMA156 TaxID=1930280 RepID=UPI001662011E|nr:hypothetical protein [Streptomyces sp. CBMA156]MBD0669587.1 hypothetical protein [Streptomyces sp. CBMA156]MBD0676791.1 hypothetical protein [Streptomyces sp. CBMA156]
MFEAVVPSLVGLELVGPEPGSGNRLRIPAGTPLLVECTGGRLTGRTTLLKSLEERYAERLPQAYADLGRADFGRPGLALPAENEAPHLRNASHASDLLFHLRYELSRRANRFGGGLSFPRLTQGLLAVTSWQAVGVGELEAAGRRLESLLRESQPDAQVRRDKVARWIRQVAPNLGAAAGLGAGVNELVASLADIVATELLGARANQSGLRWWAERRVSAQGEARVQLSELARGFRGGAQDRESAERHLMAALLADIDDHYTWVRLRNRLPRPLLLLDNAHTPLGRPVLDTLTRVWHEEGVRTRPGVLATALATEPAITDPAHPTASTRDATGPFWRADRPQTADGWTLRLPLAPLTLDEVRRMFGTDHPEPGTVQLIHRLGAGRAGIAHGLVQAARRSIRLGQDPAPRTLLDLPAEDEPGTPVHERLLRLLVPADTARARLAHFAPALDYEAAYALGTRYPPGDDGALRVQETRQLLERDRWGARPWPGGGAPFVGDPTLRALLVHHLVSRLAAAPGAGPWHDIHATLRERYAHPGTAEPDDRSLHHSLAVLDTGIVVRTLHRRLARQDAATWLATLNLVCAAPQPPGNLAVTAARPEDCPACGGANSPVHQAVELLVYGLWRQSHPLAPPDPRLIDSVQLQLLTLAQHSGPADQTVFFRAYETWPQLLRRWIQAPHLPI